MDEVRRSRTERMIKDDLLIMKRRQERADEQQE
jgi:hypothetical protein